MATMDVLQAFSTRELAYAFWLMALLVYALTIPGARKSVGGMLGVVGHWKVVLILLLLSAYVALTVYALSKTGLWVPALWKDTLVWFVTVALASLLETGKALEEKRFFEGILGRAIAIAVVVEYIVNLYTFPLLVEILTFPVLFTLSMASAFGATGSEHRRVGKFADMILAFYVVTVLILSISTVAGQILTWEGFRAFILPVTLTICLLPYLYGLVLFSGYENLFLRLRFLTTDDEIQRYARKTLFRGFGLSITKLREYSQRGRLLNFHSMEEVDESLRALEEELN